MDADHLRDLPTPVLAGRARLALALALAQTGDELLAQVALGVRVDLGADRLVRHMHFGLVRPYAPQCLRDLLA